jgi:hypothetical protein
MGKILPSDILDNFIGGVGDIGVPFPDDRGGTDKNFEKQNSQKIKFEAGIS